MTFELKLPSGVLFEATTDGVVISSGESKVVVPFDDNFVKVTDFLHQSPVARYQLLFRQREESQEALHNAYAFLPDHLRVGLVKPMDAPDRPAGRQESS